MKSDWFRKSVVYHIYPRSFKDANGDGIGDLRGIIDKLDYLNDGTPDSLGVDAIWLSPIYKSPMVDFGYDIADFYDIDPIFGDLDAFKELISEAHKRGIKVIMDFVPNHTSDKHPWFLESRSSIKNPKRDWYIWHDAKPDGSPPNNWLSVFGGSAWTFDETTGQYYLHSFFKEQPDLNWRNNEVRKEMLRICEFWLKRGVDGFRIDAVDHLIKDAQFRDEPPNPDYVLSRDDPYNAQIHIYSRNRPELFDVLRLFCGLKKNHPDIFIVSESYSEIPRLLQFYNTCPGGNYAPFNFKLLDLEWDASAYKNFIDRFESAIKPEDIPVYVMGNHDRPRLATRIGRECARTAAMLLLTLRGVPFIYYGEEIGMENGPLSGVSAAADPWAGVVPGFNFGRDPERTPMQWTSGKNAGFSRSEPWLPVAPNYLEINVEKESKEPRSILSLYKALIHYRKKSPALLYGSYEPLAAGNPQLFAFARKFKKEKNVIVLNFSGKKQTAKLDLSGAKAVISTYLDRPSARNFTLRPYEGVIFSTAC